MTTSLKTEYKYNIGSASQILGRKEEGGGINQK